MAYKTDPNARYGKSHEWVRMEGKVAVIGISDYAQHTLSDIVYVKPGTFDKRLTLQIAGLSIVLSFVFGTVLGAMRFSGAPVISHVATVYIEVVRNLPTLLLILASYFVLGLPAVWAGTIGLTIYTSAIIAEIIRGGADNDQREQLHLRGWAGAVLWRVFPV